MGFVLNHIFVKQQVTAVDADALNHERAAQLIELHERASLALENKQEMLAQREKCKLTDRLRIRRARRKLAAVEAGTSAKNLDAIDAELMAKDEIDCAALMPRLQADFLLERAKEAARQEAARIRGNDPNEEMARMLEQHCEDMRQLAADLELERELRRTAVDAEAKLRDLLADAALVARGAAPDEHKATTDMIAAEAAQAHAADDLQHEMANAAQTHQMETQIGTAVTAEIEDYGAAATALAERAARDTALLKASLEAEAQMRQARMRERLAYRKGIMTATLKSRGLDDTQIKHALAAAASSFTAEVEAKFTVEEEAAAAAALKQLEHQRRLQELHDELSRKHAEDNGALSELKDQASDAAQNAADQKDDTAVKKPVEKLNAAKSRLARRVRRREEQHKAIKEKEQAAWRVNDEYAKKWSDLEGELQATRKYKEESLFANVQRRGTELGIETIMDSATAELQQFATLDAELRTAEASALRGHREAAARAMAMISEEAAKVTASEGASDKQEPQATLSLVTFDAEVELQQLLDKTKLKLASEEINVRAKGGMVDQVSTTEAAVAGAVAWDGAAAKHAETAVGPDLVAECIHMFQEQEGRLARLEEQLAGAERRAADAERRAGDSERRLKYRRRIEA